MSQLAIYVLIFVLLGIYVPLVQIYSVQRKELGQRNISASRRHFLSRQRDLYFGLSTWQKVLIFFAFFCSILAITTYLLWDKLKVLFNLA